MSRGIVTDTAKRGAWLVGVLLLAGVAVRLLWMVLVDTLAPYTTESHNMAVALATTGRYADAFGPGTGPTAHFAPTTPLISALAYWLFGVTKTATVLLSVQAIAFVTLGFFVAYRAFGELGMARPARLVALAAVAVLPLQFSQEVREFRSFEAGIAALLIAWLLLEVLRLDRAVAIGNRALVLIGLGVGATGMINPAAGLAATGMVGILLLRRVRWTRWPLTVVATLLVVAAVTVPWTLYNERNLGVPIMTRSSLGLSLDRIYYDGELTKSRQDAYNDRHWAISPDGSPAARAAYIKLGDVEYNRRLEKRARAWMAAHPDVVRRMRLENLRDFYFPPEWFLTRFGSAGRGAEVRVALMWAASLFGFLTLAAMLWRRHWRYLYVLAAVTLPCLPYVVVYPLLRYRYLVSTLMVFLACDGAWRLWSWWRARGTVPADAAATAGAGA